MKKSIGIIGLGMVGKAVKKYFEAQGFGVLTKDLDHDLGVNDAEVVFVAVPTPYNEDFEGYDLSAIRDALNSIKDGKTVVLKSTITPGTTEELQKEFPKIKILFNPEFLTEATSDNDFAEPDRQIVGYTEKSKDLAQDILKILPMADYSKVMPAKEAEMIKLATNAYMSTKVIYFNQIYDLCEAYGIDYDQVREGVQNDWRIGPSHSNVWHGGFRGFGGKCLPKDLDALIAFANTLKDSERKAELFKLVRQVNKCLLEKKN